MLNMRHLLLTLASGTALCSSQVLALGLGEISLNSLLNQPLNAQINLLQAGDLTPGELKVRLASAEDFQRAGVERPAFLNDLRFVPVLDGQRSLIRVLSDQPVREPYLNFVVELLRPEGKLLREYTLLIDTPELFAAQSAQPVRLGEPLQSAPAPHQPARWAPATPAALPQSLRGEHYSVRPGDSLWSIAGRLRTAEVDRESLMADLFALNPQAFAAGNADRLRAGARLRLPDYLAAATRPAAPAEAAGSLQADAPLAAPASGDVGVVAESLAPAAAPVAAAAELAELQARQQHSEQALEAARNSNQQLEQRLLEIQQQLAMLQLQMNEKNQQLEQLNSSLAPAAQTPVAAALAAAGKARSTPWYQLELPGSGFLFGLLGGALLGLAAWQLARRPRAGRYKKSEPLFHALDIEPSPVRPAVARPRPATVSATAATVPDPLEGANIYMAYGRFADAVIALRQALQQQPQRQDLQFKLLEAYGELGDGASYFELQAQLEQQGASRTRLDQLRARFAQLDAAAGPVPAGAPFETVEAVGDSQPDFQLNLDELSLEANPQLLKASQPVLPQRLQEARAQAEFKSDLWQLPEVDELELGGLADELLELDLSPDGASASAADAQRVKLNMAQAYIEMGNLESACDILNELIHQGDEQAREDARDLLLKIA